MNAKTIIIALLVVGGIGAKVAFSQPKWRQAVNETQELAADQAYILQFQVKRTGKFRVTYTCDAKVHCYYLNDADHKKVQSGTWMQDPTVIGRMTAQTLAEGTLSLNEHEFSLPTGMYHLYFEPTFEENDAKKVAHISLKLSEYR